MMPHVQGSLSWLIYSFGSCMGVMRKCCIGILQTICPINGWHICCIHPVSSKLLHRFLTSSTLSPDISGLETGVYVDR